MNLTTLHQEFGTDDKCLDFIFRTKYPELRGYYRVSTRKSYVNSKGHQIYPLKGTIFERSSTSLTLWFHALFLFAVSKNGVSSAELSRQLGANYKTAHRMGMCIREVMKDEELLFGTVECDETYVGGVHKQREKFSKKKAVLGMVERGGRVRFKVVPHRGTEILIPALKANIEISSTLMTDEFRVYDKAPKVGFFRRSAKHGKGTYVRGDVQPTRSRVPRVTSGPLLRAHIGRCTIFRTIWTSLRFAIIVGVLIRILSLWLVLSIVPYHLRK